MVRESHVKGPRATKTSTPKPPGAKNDPAKARRLNDQLRANLKKRKAQVRARKPSAPET